MPHSFIFYYNQPQYLSTYFKFGNSTRLLELNYPISRSQIMSKSFVMRAAELWNIHVPLSLRSFNIPPHLYLKKNIAMFLTFCPVNLSK